MLEMNKREAVHCHTFVQQFEKEATHRCLTRVYIGSPEIADSSLRYSNHADDVLIECVVTDSAERIIITVARGRGVSEMIRLHFSIPGAIKTAYHWSIDGWQTPSGSKLDSHQLAVKVIDDAL